MNSNIPRRAWLICLMLLFTTCLSAARQDVSRAEDSGTFLVGLAKNDITPTEPVRLSGYAVRDGAHQGVADPLSVRALVISPPNAETQTSLVLVSIDSIGATAALTTEISQWLEKTYDIPRAAFVLSSTHSHAAPHLTSGLANLFTVPSTPAEEAATDRYTQMVAERIRTTIATAVNSRALAKLEIAETTVQFATNRRVIANGSWTGIGTRPEGQVDRQAKVLRITGIDGRLLGGTFQYACHCTTMGGGFNQVSGDWAGLAAARLEQMNSGAVFLPIIGCGADANPSPRGSYELAVQHSAELVDAVTQVLAAQNVTLIGTAPQASFGYAGLVPEPPTEELLKQRATSDNANERFWAEGMIRMRAERGRLPESYPMPIHTWRFGKELSWVFLGGEVVVDYQYRLANEFSTNHTWVAAYCDDVFAYVASEAMRDEGGYEVDSSMIYYLQPGRWESGTQDLIVRRVREIWEGDAGEVRALSPAESLEAIHVPSGFTVDLLASEPLVTDPVNIAFGFDGRVWVVEMSDYPLGLEGGGRVRWLRDNDGNGTLDESHIFIEGLNYPSSVFPWRDGVLIVSAPDIVFARDRDQDGNVDETEVLLSGFAEANPQHRANGFELGLDGWLYLGVGHGTRQLTSVRNGKTYSVNGHDIAWQPDTGEVRVVGGETQFVRARDAFGNWFGNSNSLPMYQFVIGTRYATLSGWQGGTEHHLLTPSVAPPVLPASRTVDRFNDLFAEQRFTSACSAMVARVPGITSGIDAYAEAFICEPVHNLIARYALNWDGAVLKGTRHPADTEFDFFASRDTWSRPVRIVNAPDGTLWVLDMTRRVIEHPEWIPLAWQQNVNLRAGERLGRIYRIRRTEYEPTTLGPFHDDDGTLLAMLASENGVLRDLATQRFLERGIGSNKPAIARLIATAAPASRAACLGLLAALGELDQELLVSALGSKHPGVVTLSLQLSEQVPEPSEALLAAIGSLPGVDLGTAVDLQWALTTSVLPASRTSDGLARVAARSGGDAWVGRALALARDPEEAELVLQAMLARLQSQNWDEIRNLDETVVSAGRLWELLEPATRAQFITETTHRWQQRATGFTPADVVLLSILGAAEAADATSQPETNGQSLRDAVSKALLSEDEPQPLRVALVSLLATRLFDEADRRELLVQLVAAESSAVADAATRTAGQLRDQPLDQKLLAHWPELTPARRALVAAALAEHHSGVLLLLDRLEQGAIAKTDLDLATINQLRGNFDRVLRSRLIAVLGKPTARGDVVNRFLKEMPVPPRESNEVGRELFTQHCAACHEARDGQAVGPAINNLAHWTNHQWITAIFNPNDAVEPKYLQSTVITSDGRVLNGIVADVPDAPLRIATTDGKQLQLPRDEVESVQPSRTSLMPEGFEEKLTPAQVAELIAYLRGRQ